MSQNVMISLQDLVSELLVCNSVLLDQRKAKEKLGLKKENLLYLVLTKQFFSEEGSDFAQKLTGRTLNDLLSAKSGKSAVVGERCALAQKLANQELFQKISTAAIRQFEEFVSAKHLHPDFPLQILPGVYDGLLQNPANPTEWASENSCRSQKEKFAQASKDLNVIRKSILYLYGTKQYPQFFWWLFLFSILQSEIVCLRPYIVRNQYKQMIDFVETRRTARFPMEENAVFQLTEADFFELRKKLVETARGRLFLSGPSLKNAFDIENRTNIITALRNAICADQLDEILICLTDPMFFFGTKCYAPARVVDSTISVLEDYFYELCELHGVELHICFFMSAQIDHSVISEEFMLFRSNKLWTDARNYKGSYMLHTADYYSTGESEFKVHRDYLNLLLEVSSDSPEMDVDHEDWDRQDMRRYHREWRKHLASSSFNKVHLHYVTDKQLHDHMCKTWLPVLD